VAQSTPLTRDDIQLAYGNGEWKGYGYLGERSRAAVTISHLEAVDNAALAVANAKRWTAAQLFDWLDSKLGRWYAESALYPMPGQSLEAIAAEFVKVPR